MKYDSIYIFITKEGGVVSHICIFVRIIPVYSVIYCNGN
jgi:hypothetical protein